MCSAEVDEDAGDEEGMNFVVALCRISELYMAIYIYIYIWSRRRDPGHVDVLLCRRQEPALPVHPDCQCQSLDTHPKEHFYQLPLSSRRDP